MHALKKLFLYAGIERDAYRSVRKELCEANRRNLLMFSSVAFAAMVIMVINSFFDAGLVERRPAYAIAAGAMGLLLAASLLAKRLPWLVYPGIYAFLEILFAFGIVMGTVVDPGEMTVTFMILLFVAPLLFTDIPLRMCAAILVGIIAYIPAAKMTQDAFYFRRNMTDLEMYGALSLIVSSMMMRVKVGRVYLEQENRFLSQWDILTGLMNRRSFEEDLLKMRSVMNHNFLVCAFDVNGLKTVNDQLGHAAGDELLQGAASCIHKVFGKYGSCYRTGGDEFIAILQLPTPDPEELLEAFRRETARWKGNLVHSLSVSIGIVSPSPESTAEDLLTQADLKMYADKKEYYSTHSK